MLSSSFFQNYSQVVAGVRLCLEKQLLMPALILIYTLMDSFAWACSDKAQTKVRTRFEAWTQQWVLTQGNLPCTATELYAARCAVLHTLTRYTDLTKNENVRKITYSWGNADNSALQGAFDALGHTDTVAVHVNDLFGAVCEAMAAITEQASTAPQLKQRLEEAAVLHFTGLEKRTVAQFLEQVHGIKNV